MRKIAVALVLIAITSIACGDGTIVLIDNGNQTPDTIKVEGNIRDVNPQVAGARIVVFVFTDLKMDAAGTMIESFRKQRSVAIASDADPADFTVTQVESGALAIVFLQDDVGNPDGQIDEGDPVATLDDPDGILDSVRRGETIRATDVDIDFGDFITGTADALTLRSTTGDGTTQ